MKNLFLAITVLFSGLTLSGCDDPRFDLSDSKIISLEAVLPEGATDFSITPGGWLDLEFVATIEKENGEIRTIRRIDYSYFAFELGVGLSVDVDDDNIRVGAESSNLRNWRTGYSLTFSVAGNPFPAQTLPLRMNFSGVTSVSYSGSAGVQGRNVQVYTALVTDEENRSWRLYRFKNVEGEPEFNRGLILPASQLLVIAAEGGDGSNGNDGSNGANISEDDDGSCPSGGSADGGDGTRGNDGGDGGTIHLYYLSTDPLAGIQLTVYGGEGGRGGDGGIGGNVCGRSGTDGEDGGNGDDGIDGQVFYYSSDLSFLQEQFANQNLAGLTW